LFGLCSIFSGNISFDIEPKDLSSWEDRVRFVDEVKIFVKSGDGGKGCISFRREKFVPRGGPDGGDGGNGGSVILVADSKRLNLLDLKFRHQCKGERGVHGKGSGKHGRRGEAFRVHLPPGTLVKDAETGEILADLTEWGQEYIAAEGGLGGRGNARFTSSTNQVPRRADPGRPGLERWLTLELKVIADAGIVGFPSAGKSSLIRALSNATPKVAAYPFTTLSPHLGTIQIDEESTYVFADIPGLIRGAHLGEGLGHKFLRHIERTRMLIHVIDLDPDTGRDPATDYEQLNHELIAYNPDLADRRQVVCANKVDIEGTKERFEKLEKTLKKQNIEVFPISAERHDGLDALLARALKELTGLDGKSNEKPVWKGPI
jgi:GTPase